MTAWPLRENGADPLQGIVHVVQDLVVRQPEDLQMRGTQKSVALPILATTGTVVGTIDLHDQAGLDADEVDDEGSKRMLSTEFQPHLAGSEASPEHLLGRCHRPAQGSATVGRRAEQTRHLDGFSAAGRACFGNGGRPLSPRERGIDDGAVLRG
jgi:hypothetical protein